VNCKHIITLAIAIMGMTSVSMAQSNDSGPSSGPRGVVYTETNGANNAVLVFNRAANGSLSLAATVPTGGFGGGVVSVGSQGTLALSQDRRWLFVANEGRNPNGASTDGSISVFERTPAGLKLAGTFSSGGTLPVSISVSRNLLYVLNEGIPAANGTSAIPANVTGFRFGDDRGALSPIPNSTRSLSAPNPATPPVGPVAAEIHFDNTGSFLYVAEVGTSLIDTYSINDDGSPSEDRIQNSFGNNPFAFIFDPRNNLLVTEIREPLGIVSSGAATSYQLNGEGILNVISGSVPDSQAAPCWIVITPNGKFAYAINTANATISGYQVSHNGELTLLGNGNSATTVPNPLDNDFTRNGRFMYVVTGSGSIIGYQVQADGSLTALTLNATVPSGARGLVAE
jgi:6-phosphogluconolactonase (cycloisomerase 2 family)